MSAECHDDCVPLHGGTWVSKSELGGIPPNLKTCLYMFH